MGCVAQVNNQWPRQGRRRQCGRETVPGSILCSLHRHRDQFVQVFDCQSCGGLALQDMCQKCKEKRYQRSPGRQYVYLIGTPHILKIGVAADPLRRLSNLQCGSPDALKILWTSPPLTLARRIELRAHKEFAHLRSHGEWFKVSASEAQKFITEQISNASG